MSPEVLLAPPAFTEALGLYVHWPFCVSKCPYCDFNSHVRDRIDADAWQAALLADLAHEAEKTGRRPLRSIFFGGGTPSLMPPRIAASLIEAAERHWGFSNDIEITLEANPNSVEAARFGDLAAAGINRVSLGLQALDNEALAFLGRAHDVDEGLGALDTARRIFDRVSFDLIYARPGQSESDWEAELARALSFGTGHLSLYQLTIEPGTRFATLAAQGKLTPVDPDHGATLYELTQAMTAQAGIPSYEISNHARPGQESRHNLIYWRYGDYVGVGPGAHGRFRTDDGACVATVEERSPERWLTAVEANGHAIVERTELTVDERLTETLLMGLRLAEGVARDRFRAETGGDFESKLSATNLSALTDANLLVLDERGLRATEDGRPRLDAVLARLLG